MCNTIALKLCSALLLCCIQSSWTQLAFHSDANTNSFTLKTPNLQQSFTRIYGIKPSDEGSEKLQQQQQQQTQPQQVDQEPQQQYTPLSNNLQYQPTQPMGQAVRYNTAYAQPVVQQQQHPNQFVAASAAYQTQQHAATPPQYAQQMQSMRAVNQQPALVAQQQPLPQAQPLEQPASSLAPYADQLNAAYYAYQQQQQLYNQQQQQLLRNLYTNHPDKSNLVSTAKAQSPVTSNNQFYTHDQYVNYLNNQHSQILDDQQRQVQQQYRTANYSKPTALAYSTPSANAVPLPMVPSRNGLLGVQYSPSNKVSHVNYASGNLAYNY